MADGIIQVPTDSTGKKVDTSELTRTDATVVERQRMVIGDPALVGALASVSDGQLLVSERFMAEVLAELRGIRLALALLIDEDPDNLLEN